MRLGEEIAKWRVTLGARMSTDRKGRGPSGSGQGGQGGAGAGGAGGAGAGGKGGEGGDSRCVAGVCKCGRDNCHARRQPAKQMVRVDVTGFHMTRTPVRPTLGPHRTKLPMPPGLAAPVVATATNSPSSLTVAAAARSPGSSPVRHAAPGAFLSLSRRPSSADNNSSNGGGSGHGNRRGSTGSNGRRSVSLSQTAQQPQQRPALPVVRLAQMPPALPHRLRRSLSLNDLGFVSAAQAAAAAAAAAAAGEDGPYGDGGHGYRDDTENGGIGTSPPPHGGTLSPLEVDGSEEGSKLARRRKTGAPALVRSESALREQALKDVSDFLRAELVVSSPLIRAVETAMLAMHAHPTVVRSSVRLVTHVREIKRSYGLDSVSRLTGDEIAQKALVELQDRVGPEHFARKMKFDPHDTGAPWWTPISVTESEQVIGERIEQFFESIKYADISSCVVVGHSLWLREICRRYSTREFDSKNPELSKNLKYDKLKNAGVVRLDFDLSSRLPLLVAARPLFDSKFKVKQRKDDGGILASLTCKHTS